MSICTSITLKENTAAGELLDVIIDGNTHALWFHELADALQFVNQDVIVEYRQDVYNGNLCQFIKTFTTYTRVNVLDKQDNFKLYSDMTDNFSNLSFNEIADGETRQGCIVFCTHSEFKSSPNSVWHELIIRDRMMHTAKLRIFNYANKEADFSGQYVMTELCRNQYGFRSEFINPVQGECPPNPEVDIAKQFIVNFFSMNVAANDFITKTDLYNHLDEVVDYEKGYGFVRLAMELSVIDAMKNITKDVNLDAIACALLASRAHITRTSILSPMVNNVFIAQQFAWSDKQLVIQLLDDCIEEHPTEYEVMKSVQKTVATLLEVRKGTKF